MPRFNAKKLALTGVGAAAVAAGIAVPGMAFAEDPTPSPTGSASASAASEADREQHEAQRRDRVAELLASELGISKDEVATTLEAVETQLRSEARAERQAGLTERLDAAVAEGTLTQDQADAILEAAEAGVLTGGPGRPGRPGPGGFDR